MRERLFLFGSECQDGVKGPSKKDCEWNEGASSSQSESTMGGGTASCLPHAAGS